jgi:hypothetical protein
MDLKSIYKDVYNTMRAEMMEKMDMKDIEVDMKEEYASIKQYKKKDDSLDISKVKFGEIKSAMEVFYQLKDKDALGEKYETREMYLSDMKNGEDSFPLQKCESYIKKMDRIQEHKDTLKDIEVNVTTQESGLDSKEFKALMAIAKEVIKKEEAVEKDKRAEERGETVNTAEKEAKKAELEELMQKIAKQLGITLD